MCATPHAHVVPTGPIPSLTPTAHDSGLTGAVSGAIVVPPPVSITPGTIIKPDTSKVGLTSTTGSTASTTL